MIGYRFTNKNEQAKYSVNKKQQRRKELLSNTLNRSTNTLFITPFVSSLDFIYGESKIIRVKGYKLFKLWTADHIHALYTSEIQDSLHSNHTVLIHKRMLKVKRHMWMCNNNPVQCTCNFIVWAMFLLNCCAEYKVIRVLWRRQGKVVQHRSALCL